MILTKAEKNQEVESCEAIPNRPKKPCAQIITQAYPNTRHNHRNILVGLSNDRTRTS